MRSTGPSARPESEPAYVEIRIPEGTPESDLPAYLLATLGCPPRSQSDIAWQRTLGSYRLHARVVAARVAGISDASGIDVVLGDLRLPDHRRQALLQRAQRNVEVAMGAAHAAMAAVLNLHLRDKPDQLALAPRSYRHPPARGEQIDRTLLAEEQLREAIAAQTADALPARRMPQFTDSPSSRKNFMARVVAPARPVLHLAIGLAQSVDRAERELLRQYGTQERWEAAGWETTVVNRGHDDPEHRPRVHEYALITVPEISRHALGLAEQIRPAVEAFLRASGTSARPAMVRLLA